jgi:ketosteroid isomerase-like protein
MKNLHLFFAAPLLAAFAVSTPGHANESDVATILQMERAWLDAVAHHDRDTLDVLLDSAYRGVTPSGAARSKSDVLNATPALAGSKQTLHNLEVQVDGDTAVVFGEDRFMAPDGQQAVFVFKDDFVRRNGQWRVAGSWLTQK